MASEKQGAFATSLVKGISEKAAELPEDLAASLTAMLEPIQHDLAKLIGDPESLNGRQASVVIDTLIEARDAVPATEFRFKCIKDDWFIVGPDGAEPWDEVTVHKANGTTKQVVVERKVEVTGLNARYTTVPPWEIKKLEEQKDRDAWVKVAERLSALAERVGAQVGRLRTAWVPKDGSNDLDFIRWGERKVLRVVGGHADTPLALAQAESALDRIEAMTDDEITQASALYGAQMEHCGRCGRHLTDRVSRAVGVGPDCRTKDGWSSFAMLASEYDAWFAVCDEAGFDTNEGAQEVADAITAGLTGPIADESGD